MHMHIGFGFMRKGFWGLGLGVSVSTFCIGQASYSMEYGLAWVMQGNLRVLGFRG